MRNKTYRINLAILIALGLPVITPAQNFHWESKLDPVIKEGYQKILLGPEITSQLKPGFPDIRIYDSLGHESPYIIFKDEAKQGIDRFVAYQIVQKNYQPGNSFIVVKNSIGNSIDHIVLEVNNADANRKMHLEGSYDGTQWFAVKDEYSVVNFNGYEKGQPKTTNLIRFDFPLTEYQFYKFEFGDWHWWWRNYQAPIFVVRAGYTEPTFIPEECLSLPDLKMSFEFNKKDKQSIYQLSFPDKQYVDHLEFSINREKEESEDYYRGATLYERIKNENDTLHPFEDRFISSTILSSLNSNEINLEGIKVQDLVLKINDHDDRPLTISRVEALQVKHYLVSKLNAKGNYMIRFGCDSLNAPVYDMKYFVDKLPSNINVISGNGRKDIFNDPVHAPGVEIKEPFFKTQAFVWTAIGIVILVLILISSRMLKEMKK